MHPVLASLAQSKYSPRMKLALILIAVAVLVASDDEIDPKGDGNDSVSTILERILPKSFPRSGSVTILNTQKESQLKVVYKGEDNSTEVVEP